MPMTYKCHLYMCYVSSLSTDTICGDEEPFSRCERTDC